jgi:hypothetical protein
LPSRKPSGLSTLKKDHLTGGASRLAALLIAQIPDILALRALPLGRIASSVPHGFLIRDTSGVEMAPRQNTEEIQHQTAVH